MHCYKKVHNAQYYKTIADIPDETWKALGCTSNTYFNPKYLSAIAAHHTDIDFMYVVLLNDFQQPTAFATIQVVNFYLDSVQNDLQTTVEKIKCFGRKFGLLSPQKPFKILTVGNSFVSGEHGIFIKAGEPKQKVIKELAQSVVELVHNEHYFSYKISAFMLKDFVFESLPVTDELLESNYHSFKVEPNMLMQIDPEWYQFEDYLAAMKTKFRVKAKKAMERSFPLEVKIITEDNLPKYLGAMNALYKNVSSKAGFNLGTFNLEAYGALKQNLGEKYIVQGYFLNNKLVGFLSAMINQQTLDAHFVGIDYKYNREFAIYQRMLYDYVQIAINQKLNSINFGRTASEIKSSVGANPQELTIYLRHKNHIPNKMLSFFIHKIQPTPFKQKTPFKIKKVVAQN